MNPHWLCIVSAIHKPAEHQEPLGGVSFLKFLSLFISESEDLILFEVDLGISILQKAPLVNLICSPKY